MSRGPRHPALARLDALVGTWAVEPSIDGEPMGRNRTTFAWIEDGAFLLEHADAAASDVAPPPEWAANSPLPVTTIIGLDDASEAFSMLYADARGVCRVYSMSLDAGVWRIWGRPGPEFFQRFFGTFGDDGGVVTARWEKSRDGSAWQLDFDLTYTRLH
jgi:hypothetical protein